MKYHKFLSSVLAVAMVTGVLATGVSAKPANDYTQEGYDLAVIAEENVELSRSMYVGGSIYSNQDITVDGAGGNKIDGYFISPTKGTVYYDQNSQLVYACEGYIHKDPNGAALTEWSTKPEYQGAVLDEDTSFDYEIGNKLFAVPEVENEISSAEANEWGGSWADNAPITVTENTHYKNLKLQGSGLTVDLSQGDIILVIDKLDSSSGKILLSGTEGNNNSFYLYIGNYTTESFEVSINYQTDNWWIQDDQAALDDMQNAGDPNRVNLFIDKNNVRVNSAQIAANLYLNAKKVELSGSSRIHGSVVTNGTEFIKTGQSYILGKVYAPAAEVEVSDSGTIFGQVVAKQARVFGQGRILYQPAEAGFDPAVPQPGPESTAEVTPEPTLEPTVEPTIEPTQMPEPTPESTTPPAYEPEGPAVNLGSNYAYIYGNAPLTDEEGNEYIVMDAERKLTRAEACALVTRILEQNGYLDGYQDPSGSRYADVSPSDWYFHAIEYIASTGAFEQKDMIEPEGWISRGEIARIISTALGLAEEADVSQYEDIDPGNPYYHDIAKLVYTGYLQGVSDTQIAPYLAMNRAEFVTMFNRIIGRDQYGMVTIDQTEIMPEDYGIRDLSGREWYYEDLMKATSSYNDDMLIDISLREHRNNLDKYDPVF